MVLAFALLLVSLASVQSTNPYQLLLDLRERDISSVGDCRGDALCESPEVSIDGNVSTKWNAPRIEDGGSTNLTLDLGREYSLSKLLLQLPSLPPPPALQLVVQVSADGDSFHSSGVPFSVDSGSCPRALCSVMNQAVPSTLASFLRLQFVQLSSSSLNFSVVELGVLVACDSPLCPDCGACVDRLLVELDDLRDRMAAVNASIPPVSVVILVNETELRRIQDTILLHQDSAQDWLLRLIAAERLVGFTSLYPANITLPAHIQELEDNFTDTIISKLTSLRALTSRPEIFRIVEQSINSLNQSLAQLLDGLRNIEVLSNSVFDFSNTVLSNLSISFSVLSDSRNMLNTLLSQANTTLATISSRSFAQDDARLASLETQLNRFSNLSALFVSGEEFRVDLLRASQLLQRVIDLSNNVVADSMNISNDIANLRTLIMNIQMRFPEAILLANMTRNNNADAQLSGDRVQPLLINGTNTSQAVNSTLEMLQNIIINLQDKVTAFRLVISPFLPSDISCLDDPDRACIEAERHSRELAANFTLINSSRPALEEAQSFLDSLQEIPDIDFAGLNATAQSAISISAVALGKLSSSNVSATLRSASEEESASRQVAAVVAALQGDAMTELSGARLQLNRSREQEARFVQLENTVTSLNDTVQELIMLPDLAVEARRLNRTANEISLKLETSRNRVDEIERRLPDVQERVRNLTAAVRESELLLNRTDENILQTRRLLQRASPLTNSSTGGLTTLMNRNSDLLEDIDSLIRSVIETHDLIKTVNAPTVLRRNTEISRPFISLQPPPAIFGRNELLQFETLDIYLTPDTGYMTPALLFYAGPAVDTSRGSDRSSLTDADYIAITATTNNRVELAWRLGSNTGAISQAFSIGSQTEVFVTRVGSQLELQVSGGPLEAPTRRVVQQNCSLVFQSVSNTVYYIGGRPEEVELVSSVPATINSFVGTYQLILFNGDLWTLWDYRSRSNTDFFDFNTHASADNNAWFPSSRSIQGELLSFDGNGYVRPTVMAPASFTNAGEYQFYFRVRSTKGLLAYMFDRERNVSMEVALRDGQLHVEMRWDSEVITYSRPMLATDLDPPSSRLGDLLIQYRSNAVQIRSSGVDMIYFQSRGDFQSSFRSFGDLRRVEAWFGGVDPSMIEEPFVPRITRQGFRGCFIIELHGTSSGTVFPFILRNGFLENYLMSPVQQHISGTCIGTAYVSEVGFDGQSLLSYNRLLVERKPNEDPEVEGMVDLPNQLSLSLSFYPQNSSGVILLARSTAQGTIMVSLQEGRVMVRVAVGDSAVNVTSQTVSLQNWHQLLVNLQFNNPGDNVLLFLDNKQVGSSRLTGLTSFTISTTTTTPPPLLLGGTDSNENLGNFVGCLKNLAYNFDAIAFLSGALNSEGYSAPGVTFNQCPYLSGRRDARIPLSPNAPRVQTCFASPPVSLDNTHGGFHSNTRLTSGNIIGLDTRSWNLSLSFRRSSNSAVGRVMTITFTSGAIELSVAGSGGSLVLVTRDSGGGMLSNESISLTNNLNVWIDVILVCDTDSGRGQCDVTVMEPLIRGGIVTSSRSTAELSIPDTFNPQLPLVFGSFERDGTTFPSFVGCLRNLRVNGDGSGFANRRSCVACYADIFNANGFSGASYIIRNVTSTPESTVRFQFRATQEQGLLLLLTDRLTRQPVFGLGLFEGELRATNFSSSGSLPFMGSFCANSSFHLLNLTINADSVTVMVDSTTMIIGYNTTTSLTSYIGGVPDDFSVEDGTLDFSFLLSGLSPPGTLPPSFIGCITQIMPPVSSDVSRGVLTNYCPQPQA